MELMRTYSVFYQKSKPLDGEGLILVPEGFNWAAFLIPIFWALRFKLWLGIAVYVIAAMILQFGTQLIVMPEVLYIAADLGLAVFFATTAADFRHRQLKKNGYQELEPVTAVTRYEAERAVLDHLSAVEFEKMNNQVAATGQSTG
jgi:Protein of unknown function (DUF2628)